MSSQTSPSEDFESGLQVVSFQTANELRQTLDDLAGVQVKRMEATRDAILFTIDVSHSVTRQGLRIETQQIAGIPLELDGTVDVVVNGRGELTIGVRRASGESELSEFFLAASPQPELTFTAAGAASNLAAQAQLGFLEVGVENGQAALSLSTGSLKLLDPG